MRRPEQDEFESISQQDSEFKVRRPLFEQDRKRKLFQKWSLEENMAYAGFLGKNLDQFQNSNGRRSMKFFNKMAQVLGNGRNNQQCRSHHQKMIKKYRNVHKVISALTPKQVAPKEDPRPEESTVQPSNKVFEQATSQELSPSPPSDRLELILLNEDDFLEGNPSNLFCFNECPFGLFL